MAFAQFVEAVLYYGVVSVGRMGSAVSHNQYGVSLGQFRELGGHSFREIFYIVRLFFLALPVQQRGAESHFLELIAIQTIDRGFIFVFHAGDYVQSSQGNAGIAFSFQLFQCFFRGRNYQTFIGFYAVNDDMGSVSGNHFYAGQRFLDRCNGRVDGLVAGFFHGGAEGHNYHSVLIGQVLQGGVAVRANADFRSLFQGRGRSLNFLAQAVSSVTGDGDCQAANCHSSGSHHFTKFFHFALPLSF